MLVTQPQYPFGQPSGPQFGNPYGRSTQSSFGGWGGGAGAQFAPPQGRPLPQQQFGQQYQGGPFPPPGQFGPAPVKKSGPPPILLGALIGAGLLLAGMLVYALFTGGDPEQVGPDYRNEDYEVPTVTNNPPVLPAPTTDEELFAYLEENPLYEQNMPVPVRCEISLDDGVHSLTDEELEERLATFVGCLTRAWGPTLEAAGFEAYTPRVTVYPAGGTVNTQCGTAESMNAFYCGGDQNLYLAPDIARVLSPEIASERVLFELIMAHEYGHALQGRTAIFISSRLVEVQAPEDVALEFSRRVEVQADCLAGLGLQSLGEGMGFTQEDLSAIPAISNDIGDDVLRQRFGGDPTEVGNHGLGENRQLWATRGLSDTDISVCNTWVAPTEEVR